MKTTVFTSNQPRHLSLVNRISSISDEVYCVQECNTVFPGQASDFYNKSETMEKYFKQVMLAERGCFGELGFLPQNVRSLSIKGGDLSNLDRTALVNCLDSDLYIVFGASYIRGWLAKFLVKNRALNIHMGLSPYYRGSSCNFWALYDNNPNYVGATIHMLSEGLDSGPILYHCVPRWDGETPFEFTMKSALVAHKSLTSRIKNGEVFEISPTKQCKNDELRYTKNADFTDVVATEFLERELTPELLSKQLNDQKRPELLDPYFD